MAELETTEAYGFTFAYPSGDTVVGPCLSRYGEFARITSTLSATLARGGAFIDVGANIGAVSLPASRIVREVVAVEAHPGLAKILQRNVDTNDIRNIVVRSAAAVSNRGPVVFPAIPLDATANFGAGGGPGALGHHTEVQGVTIDDIAPQDTLVLKIDVEGSELDVLKGAANLIQDRRPAIIAEFNDLELVAYLSERQYRCYWLWEPFVTPLAPKAKWTSQFRGDLSILARHEKDPQPAEMVRAMPGDSPPKTTEGFAYLRRFGIRERAHE